jgi:hypothetical protein
MYSKRKLVYQFYLVKPERNIITYQYIMPNQKQKLVLEINFNL